MKKRLLCVIMAGLFAAALTAGCGSSAESAGEVADAAQEEMSDLDGQGETTKATDSEAQEEAAEASAEEEAEVNPVLFEDFKTAAVEAGFDEPKASDVTTEVMGGIQGKYQSFKLSTVYSAGDSYEFSKYYTTDVNTDAIITLDELLGGDESLYQAISDSVLSQMRGQMTVDDSNMFWIDGNEPSESDAFTGIDKDTMYYLDINGMLTICFAEGIVGPYSMGTVEFTIPGDVFDPASEVSGGASYKVSNLVGEPTDYSDENNWYRIPETNDKEVDTFFVYPTVYINPEEGAHDIVPIDDETMRAGVASNYKSQAVLYEDLTNLYEPYYRQSNLAALIGKSPEEFMEFQYQEQRTDVYAALDYYFENYNEGRPFILAGHSQGSMMLKIALRDYFKEHTDYLDRMVAAYVLGFSITKDDLTENPALKFAEGADDVGVIVSWNTEGPGNKNEDNVVVVKDAISINPINWKRDDTKAEASENLGDHLPVKDNKGVITGFDEKKPGRLDAQVDTGRGVVVCTTMAGNYITVDALDDDTPNPFGPESLHNMDYAGYWENIRENVQTRIQHYLELNK